MQQLAIIAGWTELVWNANLTIGGGLGKIIYIFHKLKDLWLCLVKFCVFMVVGYVIMCQCVCVSECVCLERALLLFCLARSIFSMWWNKICLNQTWLNIWTAQQSNPLSPQLHDMTRTRGWEKEDLGRSFLLQIVQYKYRLCVGGMKWKIKESFVHVSQAALSKIYLLVYLLCISKILLVLIQLSASVFQDCLPQILCITVVHAYCCWPKWWSKHPRDTE